MSIYLHMSANASTHGPPQIDGAGYQEGVKDRGKTQTDTEYEPIPPRLHSLRAHLCGQGRTNHPHQPQDPDDAHGFHNGKVRP